MPYTRQHLRHVRQQFPALGREIDGKPVVYFDGPAGTQTPQRVIDAVANCLAFANANHGGAFVTSRESDAMLDQAHQAAADLLGAADPAETVFGPNMTTLTFALSRALATTWRRGDEVVVTRLDHHANVSPWTLAARDAGAVVRQVGIRREDCTLDLDELRSFLSKRTRLVAVGCASNATGGVNPVADICRWAHEAGALVFLDAVHHAPHALIDVAHYGCDFLACSAYKFFGPHVGILWGRRELLESLPAYKVRPAPETLPERWMTGTQSHEGIAGALAAVDYLAELGRTVADDARLPRRDALKCAYHAIGDYERQLSARVLSGVSELPDIQVYGHTRRERLVDRHPTFSITHRRVPPWQMATRLGERGVFTWHGNYYALSLTETLGLEPNGMLRFGIVHYNTEKEVDRLLDELAKI